MVAGTAANFIAAFTNQLAVRLAVLAAGLTS